MCVTSPAHLILFHFVTLIMLGEQHKLWTFSLFLFLHPPVTSCLFDPNILFKALVSVSLSLYSRTYFFR
jgi:hypothetical protein